MPAARAASTSQPTGVNGDGWNGCCALSSAVLSRLLGGVRPLLAPLFGEADGLGGVVIPAISAASLALALAASCSLRCGDLLWPWLAPLRLAGLLDLDRATLDPLRDRGAPWRGGMGGATAGD